jgi:hypothetical protein
MPTGPKGEKRLPDVNARAVMIAKIATGEVEDILALIDARDARRAERKKDWNSDQISN